MALGELIIRGPNGDERREPIAGDAIVFGRVEGADVVLPGRLVSRKHARLFRQGAGWIVEDLQSANGTFVEGRRVSGRAELPPGGSVTVGEYTVTVALPPELPAPVRGGDVGGSGLTPIAEISARLLPLDPETGEPRTEIALPIPPTGGVVGRTGQSADIVVDDASVSRQHARISFERGQWRIADLSSSNGTTVNGGLIKEALMRPGDSIGFGKRVFRFEVEAEAPNETRVAPAVDLAAASKLADESARASRQAARAAAASGSGPRAEAGRSRSKSKRKKGGRPLVIGAAIGVFVLGGGVVVLGKLKADKNAAAQARLAAAAKKGPTIFQEMATAAAAAIEAGRKFAEANDWESAIRAYEKGLDADPVNHELRAALAKARSEAAVAQVIKDAEMNYNLDKLDVARALYLSVPPESEQHRKIRARVREVNARLATKLMSEALTLYGNERWDRAYEKTCQVLQITPDDSKAQRLLKNCAASLRQLGRRFEECVLPTVSEESVASAESDSAVREALDKKYPYPRVRDAMVEYVRGELDAADRDLRKLKSDAKGDEQRAAEELIEQLKLVQGRFQSGQTSLLRGALNEAKAEWDEALAKDAKLVPKGIQSHLAREMRRQIGDAFYKQGQEDFEKGRHAQAFESWARGLSTNADHIDLLNGMKKLEEVAADWNKQAERFEAAKDMRAKELWTKVLAVTQEASPARRQAQDKLARFR